MDDLPTVEPTAPNPPTTATTSPKHESGNTNPPTNMSNTDVQGQPSDADNAVLSQDASKATKRPFSQDELSEMGPPQVKARKIGSDNSSESATALVKDKPKSRRSDRNTFKQIHQVVNPTPERLDSPPAKPRDAQWDDLISGLISKPERFRTLSSFLVGELYKTLDQADSFVDQCWRLFRTRPSFLLIDLEHKTFSFFNTPGNTSMAQISATAELLADFFETRGNGSADWKHQNQDISQQPDRSTNTTMLLLILAYTNRRGTRPWICNIWQIILKLFICREQLGAWVESVSLLDEDYDGLEQGMTHHRALVQELLELRAGAQSAVTPSSPLPHSHNLGNMIGDICKEQEANAQKMAQRLLNAADRLHGVIPAVSSLERHQAMPLGHLSTLLAQLGNIGSDENGIARYLDTDIRHRTGLAIQGYRSIQEKIQREVDVLRAFSTRLREVEDKLRFVGEFWNKRQQGYNELVSQVFKGTEA